MLRRSYIYIYIYIYIYTYIHTYICIHTQDDILLRYDTRQTNVRMHVRAICLSIGVIFIVGSSAMALSSIVSMHVVAPVNKMISLIMAFANVRFVMIFM
jgi:hypothetical protein